MGARILSSRLPYIHFPHGSTSSTPFVGTTHLDHGCRANVEQISQSRPGLNQFRCASLENHLSCYLPPTVRGKYPQNRRTSRTDVRGVPLFGGTQIGGHIFLERFVANLSREIARFARPATGFGVILNPQLEGDSETVSSSAALLSNLQLVTQKSMSLKFEPSSERLETLNTIQEPASFRSAISPAFDPGNRRRTSLGGAPRE